MSWGGSVHAMIVSLKYNNSQLRKKRVFTDLKKYIKEETNKRIYSKESASLGGHVDENEVKRVVAEIKQEMRKKNRRIRRYSVILAFAVALLLSYFIYWAVRL